MLTSRFPVVPTAWQTSRARADSATKANTEQVNACGGSCPLFPVSLLACRCTPPEKLSELSTALDFAVVGRNADKLSMCLVWAGRAFCMGRACGGRRVGATINLPTFRKYRTGICGGSLKTRRT